MANKTSRYYFRTLQSKIIAIAHFYLDKFGLLWFYKKPLQKKFEEFFYMYFTDNLTNDGVIWNPTYITYLRFIKPEDLAKDLLFDNNQVPLGSAWHPPPDYNPLFPAYYALVCYNHYLKSGDEKSLNKFIKQAEFLANFGIEYENCFILMYRKDFDLITHLKAPFYTGITQALALSVFIRASYICNLENYRRLAEKTWNSFYLPVEQGGIYRIFESKYDWIEEYPVKIPDLTLNGFLFNIIAGYEFYHFVGKKDAIIEERLRKMLRSFFYLFSRYRFGKYTKYNLRHFTFHNIPYQGLFVFMFLHLFHLSGKKIFHNLAFEYHAQTNWKAYLEFYELETDIDKIIKIYRSC